MRVSEASIGWTIFFFVDGLLIFSLGLAEINQLMYGLPYIMFAGGSGMFFAGMFYGAKIGAEEQRAKD